MKPHPDLKPFALFSSRFRTVLLVAALCLPLLGACTKQVPIWVETRGVNYTEDVYGYSLVNPSNREDTGGSGIVPIFSKYYYGRGFNLPPKWHAKMNIELSTTVITSIYFALNFPLEEKAIRDTIKYKKNNIMVEVPFYEDGKPEALWIVRSPDGSFSLEMSAVGPGEKNWPGKIKDVPTPTPEFLQKVQDIIKAK